MRTMQKTLQYTDEHVIGQNGSGCKDFLSSVYLTECVSPVIVCQMSNENRSYIVTFCRLCMGKIIDFIYEGYEGFRAIKDIDYFFVTVDTREHAWHGEIWSKDSGSSGSSMTSTQ